MCSAHLHGIELTVIHTALGINLAPSVAIKPSVKHVNAHTLLDFLGKRLVLRVVDNLTVEV